MVSGPAAGVVAYYVPSSVIKGMLAGIGLTLILKQLPHALGYDGDYEGDMSFIESSGSTTLGSLVEALQHVQPGAVTAALLGVGVMLWWPRSPFARVKLLPAPMVAVGVGMVMNEMLRIALPDYAIRGTHLVSLPTITNGDFAQTFALPEWSAMSGRQHGLVNHWLGPIRNVLRWNKEELDAIPDPQARFDRLVELNVLEQVYQLSETPIIQQAWARGRRPLLHGLVYSLKDGILHEVATGIDSQDAADHLADRRLSGVAAGPPPIGRVAAPILAGDALADEIANRVIARMAEASEKRPPSR